MHHCYSALAQIQKEFEFYSNSFLEPPFDLTAQTVEWSRDADVIVHVYRSRADNQFLQNQKFRGRTVLIHQNLKDGKVSLRLINITKEDEGNYSCSEALGLIIRLHSLQETASNNAVKTGATTPDTPVGLENFGYTGFIIWLHSVTG
uniref:Ig-like domain-containing protein n=1 Tax=Oryzias melastigma TaxID=30732 RepID=A0A3B3CDI6_ORYME